jgi:putative FmdB family regulatory protein
LLKRDERKLLLEVVMPTYEYECEKCGKFEVLQNITAKPLKQCSRCGSRVQRLIGAGSGVIFKGSGFYETDYKRKSFRQSGSSEKTSTDKKEEKAQKDSKREQKN